MRMLERMAVGVASICSIWRAAFGWLRRIRWIWMGESENKAVSALEKKAEKQSSTNKTANCTIITNVITEPGRNGAITRLGGRKVKSENHNQKGGRVISGRNPGVSDGLMDEEGG
jgi:hypothetical protein